MYNVYPSLDTWQSQRGGMREEEWGKGKKFVKIFRKKPMLTVVYEVPWLKRHYACRKKKNRRSFFYHQIFELTSSSSYTERRRLFYILTLIHSLSSSRSLRILNIIYENIAYLAFSLLFYIFTAAYDTMWMTSAEFARIERERKKQTL